VPALVPGPVLGLVPVLGPVPGPVLVLVPVLGRVLVRAGRRRGADLTRPAKRLTSQEAGIV